MALIPSRLIRQMLAKGLDLNSKGLYQSSGKEKESCCLVFPFSTKREIKQFQCCSRATEAEKCTKSVLHVQSCWFTYLNLLLFCRSRCRRRRRCREENSLFNLV